MNNKARPLLALMLLAMSATTIAAQYQFVVPINGISASPADRIKSFLLDNTTFSEYEPIGVAWDVAAKPDWVTITEIGKVTAKGQWGSR